MTLVMIKDLPRYECLLEAAREFPDLDPSATEVFLNVLRAGDEAFRIIESQLAGHDITQGRFGVLMALWGNARRCGSTPSMSPAELAERTGVTRATMTGLVDTLERDGFVKRQPATGDRRMVSVRITPQGEQLLAQILPEHFRQMAWLMAPLPETERKTLVELLTKILSRAAEPVAKPEPAASAG